MAMPHRFDPLLYLSAEGSLPQPSENGEPHPSPAYSDKPAPAPPYSPPSASSQANASSSNITPSPTSISRPLSPPPDYNTSDPLARDFHLSGNLVYANGTPQYQIKTTLTRSGRRAHQLHLRRLLPTEIRRAHLLTTTKPQPPLPYDDDTTAYTATLHPSSAAVQIHTPRLPGHISITPSPFSSTPLALFPGQRSTRFTHRTRNPRFDALDPAHEARVQKYGYHAEEEWRGVVVLQVRRKRGGGREWLDGEGRLVGEEEEGRLRLAGGVGVGDKGWRDLVVMCWVVWNWGRGRWG